VATGHRLRDHFTRSEVRALLRATKRSKRYGARNYAMILHAYRHGFAGFGARRAAGVRCRSPCADDLPQEKEGIELERAPDERDEVEAIQRMIEDRAIGVRDFFFCEHGIGCASMGRDISLCTFRA
jgi:hypothetical protein